MEFWSYTSKHWNAVVIVPIIGILILYFQTLEFCCYPSKLWNSRPINKLWDSHLILSNIGILSFSFQTLEFWACFYTHRFSYPILSNSGILALFLLALELLSYPCKHCNADVILPNTGILPNFFKHWNFGPVLINLGIMIFSFKKTLDFWPYFYRLLISDHIFPNSGIVALFI